MVEEGELMVPCQCRQPKRQPREINRARVLVDPIEAALRDKPTGVKLLILVRRNGGPRLRPARPSRDQTLAQSAASLDEKGARSHGRVAHL